MSEVESSETIRIEDSVEACAVGMNLSGTRMDDIALLRIFVNDPS